MVNYIIIVLICMLAILSKIHYSKYKDEEGANNISYLLIGHYLYDIFKKRINLSKISSCYRKIEVGNKNIINQQVRTHCARIISLSVFIILIASAIACVSSIGKGKSSENKLYRNDYGNGEKSYDLEVESKYGINEMTITVDEVWYSYEDYKKQVDKTVAWLNTEILNENISLDNVISDLYFPQFNEEGTIEIIWSTDNIDLVSRKGIVNNKLAKKDTIVSITATMIYKDFEDLYTFPVVVKEVSYTGEEELQMSIASRIAEYDEINKYNKQFMLPTEIEESKVTLKNNKKRSNVQIILFGVLLSALVIVSENEKLAKKAKARDEHLIKSYPFFVNRLSLLIGAGETIKGALTVIALENNNQEILIKEIRFILNEISAGISEEEAYNKLGKRIGLSPYLKFMGIISQNLKRGTSDIKRLLYEEQEMAFNFQKEYARKKGEEASTKLLIPMIMLMVVVMVIIIYPAVVNFNF